MAGYAKLFGSILQSTIWEEDAETKVVWITMLALADRHGEVAASIPGLARSAQVPLAVCERALKKFKSPDKYSRTKDDAGRRIEDVDGGWLIVNFEKYRRMAGREDQLRKHADRQKRYRERLRVTSPVTDRDGQEPPDPSPSPSPPPSPSPAQIRSEAPARARGVWGPSDWRTQYGRAWCDRYRQVAYGMPSDSKACAALADVLKELPEAERVKAQSDSARMFAEFLGSVDPRVVQRRHPFAFFVQEWGGLRVPKPNGEVARQRENDDKRLERETLARLRAETAAAAAGSGR